MSVTLWTAAKVKALRANALRETQVAFALRSGFAEITVQKWERGGDDRALKGLRAAEAMDTIYRSLDDEQRKRFWAAVAEAEPPAAEPPAVVSNGIDLLRDVAFDNDDLLVWLTVNRRHVIALMGLLGARLPTVAALMAPLDDEQRDRMARVIVSPERVDEAAISDVEKAVAIALSQEDRHGPYAVMEAVKSQRDIANGLRRAAPERLQRRIAALYSQLSKMAGWLAFDVNNRAAAAAYYDAARRAAHDAYDQELLVLALCNMSYLETWADKGNPGVGVDHAVAARHWAASVDDPLMRGYAEMTLAIALAADGQDKRCRQALESAEDNIIGTPPVGADQSLAYFAGEGLLASRASACLLRFGDKPGALAAAQRSLELISTDQVRNRSIAYLYLADVHVAAGDVEQAALAIADGALLAADCRADRLLDAIAATRRGLDRWQNVRPVRELDEQLVAYRMGSRPGHSTAVGVGD